MSYNPSNYSHLFFCGKPDLLKKPALFLKRIEVTFLPTKQLNFDDTKSLILYFGFVIQQQSVTHTYVISQLFCYHWRSFFLAMLRNEIKSESESSNMPCNISKSKKLKNTKEGSCADK